MEPGLITIELATHFLKFDERSGRDRSSLEAMIDRSGSRPALREQTPEPLQAPYLFASAALKLSMMEYASAISSWTRKLKSIGEGGPQ
jgi:hypothetical protein